MVSANSYILYKYNTNNNVDINIKDAVKVTLVTPNLIKESFWVEVIEILNNGELLCTIQNKLNEAQPVNYLDEIIIDKSHIREYKEKNKRFKITPEIREMYRNALYDFIIRNGRMPSLDEIMAEYNVRVREFNH